MEGIDLVMLDATAAGCLSVWLEQQGLADDRGSAVLAECEQRLNRVIPRLDAHGREYYQQLLDMTVLVLETNHP